MKKQFVNDLLASEQAVNVQDYSEQLVYLNDTLERKRPFDKQESQPFIAFIDYISPYRSKQ